MRKDFISYRSKSYPFQFCCIFLCQYWVTLFETQEEDQTNGGRSTNKVGWSSNSWRGRSAQIDDDGCDIFAELLPPAAAIDHPTVDEWGVEGGDGGVGGIWAACVAFTHNSPPAPKNVPRRHCWKSIFWSNTTIQPVLTRVLHLEIERGQRLQVLTGRIVHIKL